MAVWSEILKSETCNRNRLDAEFFQPMFLQVEERLKIAKALKLDDLLDDVRYGVNVPPDYVDQGLPFVRALNLKEYGIEGEILNIPYTLNEIGYSNTLHKGDILIVRSGANVGDLGLVLDSLVGSTFGSYVIRIRSKNINPYYLYVYLKSRFGRTQTIRLRSGAAQPNISLPNLKELLVFLPSDEMQKEIETIFLSSYRRRIESEILYSEAEFLLLRDLGLDSLDLSPQIAHTTNFSEAMEARRLDADYSA
ncbi:MAG: restriction endonuclease subunit S [Methanotrichaceae archaeon]|nr:restriction endonuclease subunit S [Methanotrichaceae archaeon]